LLITTRCSPAEATSPTSLSQCSIRAVGAPSGPDEPVTAHTARDGRGAAPAIRTPCCPSAACAWCIAPCSAEVPVLCGPMCSRRAPSGSNRSCWSPIGARLLRLDVVRLSVDGIKHYPLGDSSRLGHRRDRVPACHPGRLVLGDKPRGLVRAVARMFGAADDDRHLAAYPSRLRSRARRGRGRPRGELGEPTTTYLLVGLGQLAADSGATPRPPGGGHRRQARRGSVRSLE